MMDDANVIGYLAVFVFEKVRDPEVNKFLTSYGP